jgi:SAM-dependent methyltransferase
MDRAPGARSKALDGKYALDTAQPDEKQRLDEQAKLWDPLSFRQLAGLGVADGWRCLEVGGGTGTVARWLSERVGRTGQVVGTDLVTRWMDDVRAPNLQVRRHDIVVDPLEESTYDLVHARLVLTHLPQRDAIVTKLIGALKPGGWLLLEDADSQNFGVCHPPHALWARVAAAILGALDSAGADHEYGRRLPATLRSAGLTDIAAEGLLHTRPAPDLAPVFLPLLERLRERILDLGLATAADLDGIVDEFHDESSSLWIFWPILVSARGRRGDA